MICRTPHLSTLSSLHTDGASFRRQQPNMEGTPHHMNKHVDRMKLEPYVLTITHPLTEFSGTKSVVSCAVHITMYITYIYAIKREPVCFVCPCPQHVACKIPITLTHPTRTPLRSILLPPLTVS